MKEIILIIIAVVFVRSSIALREYTHYRAHGIDSGNGSIVQCIIAFFFIFLQTDINFLELKIQQTSDEIMSSTLSYLLSPRKIALSS